jgi:hypothetical protein
LIALLDSLLRRAPLIGLSLLALIAGLWAGLIRIGWQLPPLHARLPSAHGALMISGFLGALISLERAVALPASPDGGARRWPYLAPAMSALGGLTLLIGLPDTIGRALITFGSLTLAAAFAPGVGYSHDGTRRGAVADRQRTVVVGPIDARGRDVVDRISGADDCG